MPPIVTFIGYHNSGKTTVSVDVVRYLKSQGYNVAVVKSSGFENAQFDSEGTDTHKYKEAGADNVMFAGPDQMVLQGAKTELALQTIVHRYFPDADIVIGEGFKYGRQIPKIEVRRDPEKSLKGDVHGIIAVVTEHDVVGDYVFRPHEAEEIGMFIEKRFLSDGQRDTEKTVLLVNGHKVHINSFIQGIIAGSVTGMVSSLKLKEDVTEVELRVVLE